MSYVPFSLMSIMWYTIVYLFICTTSCVAYPSLTQSHQVSALSLYNCCQLFGAVV